MVLEVYMLASRIKELREEKGMSQRDLANLCQISKSSIDAYETGRRKPKQEALEAISDVFNVDIEYLQGKTNIRNAVANSLGYGSLEEWYKKTHSPSSESITDDEREFLEFYRSLPDDVKPFFVKAMEAFGKVQEQDQQMVLNMIRAALGTQG
jgi:transcriptional regulator with XRE-family HTH domain